MSFTTNLSGVLLGAGLMYFLDPARGRKRRARIIDAATHARRVEHELVGKAVRDAQHRAQGLAERVRHPYAAEVSDAVVEGRVRAQLGRVTSHPRALEIDVRDGRVIVRGPIYAREADRLLRALRAVAGVREIDDKLERHDTAASVPALQGEGRLRRRGTSWPPAMQVAAIGTGAALVGYGIVRRGLPGLVVGAAGGALVARGLMNRPLRAGEGVTVHKTVTVRAPIDKVFDLWTRFDEFPHFMEHVREVQVNGDRSRWKVEGAPGTTVSFEVETTRLEPNRLIAWRTLPEQAIRHEGVIRFEDAGKGATRIHVQLSYFPPAGVVGHTIARILGFDPKRRMDDDFIRMKALLEAGHTRAHHQRIDLSKLH